MSIYLIFFLSYSPGFYRCGGCLGCVDGGCDGWFYIGGGGLVGVNIMGFGVWGDL
jgi:hypothetical protein